MWVHPNSRLHNAVLHEEALPALKPKVSPVCKRPGLLIQVSMSGGVFQARRLARGLVSTVAMISRIRRSINVARTPA
jgi:hypothetical protein